eukprot:749282-Hanusia_phi.AAC.5
MSFGAGISQFESCPESPSAPHAFPSSLPYRVRSVRESRRSASRPCRLLRCQTKIALSSMLADHDCVEVAAGDSSDAIDPIDFL